MTRQTRTANGGQVVDRATDRLLTTFKAMISAGTLVAGCRLPPEREMAKQFGVSRATLRQVLKLLGLMGVVSQRVGDGTYLSANATSVLEEPMTFLMLVGDISYRENYEARFIVEPELAARAAERATTQDLVAMQQANTAMRESDTSEAVYSADLAFHTAVARASGNRPCELIFSVLQRTIYKSCESFLQHQTLDELKSAVQRHDKIQAAIKSRDPEKAHRMMREHLADGLNRFDRMAMEMTSRKLAHTISRGLPALNTPPQP